jgi:hypothetical protein
MDNLFSFIITIKLINSKIVYTLQLHSNEFLYNLNELRGGGKIFEQAVLKCTAREKILPTNEVSR